jgi:hypothetical protein
MNFFGLALQGHSRALDPFTVQQKLFTFLWTGGHTSTNVIRVEMLKRNFFNTFFFQSTFACPQLLTTSKMQLLWCKNKRSLRRSECALMKMPTKLSTLHSHSRIQPCHTRMSQ